MSITGRRKSWRQRLVAMISAGALVGGVVTYFAVVAGATLNGTTFNAGDGNLVVDGTTESDWKTPPSNLWVQTDKATGQQDDSFGQGTAENTEPPSVVDGSIPNNKSDLSRFYIANERTNSQDFLYLGWARVQDPTGTTNMDFELNQKRCVWTTVNGQRVQAQGSNCSSNGVTPVRTAGDVLIKYDLSNGGTNPTIGYHTWITTATTEGCEAGGKLPCWQKGADLNPQYFDASINGSAIASTWGGPNSPVGGQSTCDPETPSTCYSARTFGEAAVNLTGSRIFPASGCRTFGSAYLKSRSSDSFTAALKDFIEPRPVSVSNCGSINVNKRDNQSTPQPIPDVVFTLYPDNGTIGGTRSTTVDVWPNNATAPTCTTDSTGACPNGGFTNLTFGYYWLVETVPSGYSLPSGTSAEQSVQVDSTTPVVRNITNNRITYSGSLASDASPDTPIFPSTATNVSDSATYTLGQAGGTPTNSNAVVFTLHGPFDVGDTTFQASDCARANSSASPPTTGNEVARVTTTFSGSGITYTASTGTVSVNLAEGDYYWVVTYAGDGGVNLPSGPHGCGDETERLQVRKASPTGITLQALRDTLSVTAVSGAPVPSGAVNFKLYRDDPAVNGANACDVLVYDSSDTNKGGTGNPSLALNNSKYTATSDVVAGLAAGTYNWVVTWSGNSGNNGVTKACGSETAVISYTPANP